MAEWKMVKLGDIAKTNTSTYSPKENWEFVNYLDTGSITMNTIDEYQYINTKVEKLPSRARRKVKANSIIYSTVRPNQLHYGIIKSTPANFLVSTGFTVVDVNENEAIPDFIYYALTQREVTEHLQAIAEQSVSAYPSIKSSDLEEVEIMLPDLESQKQIVSILGTIDGKIKHNVAINNNLLEQVTAKFQNMFGKYDNDKSVYRTLGTIAKFKYGTMPKKDKLGTGRHLAFSGYQVVGSYPEVMYPEPQLIIVARGVGGCGEIKYTPANCYLTNLAIAIITNCVEHDDYLYHYLRLHDTKVMNTGSAQPQITVSSLEKYVIPIPTEDELLVFSNFVKPFKELYRANVATNERLTALRDTLLPKLMSSELDVSDLDL